MAAIQDLYGVVFCSEFRSLYSVDTPPRQDNYIVVPDGQMKDVTALYEAIVTNILGNAPCPVNSSYSPLPVMTLIAELLIGACPDYGYLKYGPALVEEAARIAVMDEVRPAVDSENLETITDTLVVAIGDYLRGQIGGIIEH